MNIPPPSEPEEFATEKIASGVFTEANNVILERLRDEIRIGIDQAEDGRTSVFDESTLEAVKARGKRRLA